MLNNLAPPSPHNAIDKLINRILELSADAQIQRRCADADSPAFHTLTGAVAAYGKVLRLLAKAQQTHDERYLVIGQFPVEFAEATRPL